MEETVYSVWAMPPEDVAYRLKKLMTGLRSEFGGPEFEPHITVAGAIRLTKDDALHKLNSACEGFKPYTARLTSVFTGNIILVDPNSEVMEAGAHFAAHFGDKNSTPYLPHLSLLYGDLTDDKKKAAQERAKILDEGFGTLAFPISRIALYKTEINEVESWEKVADYNLN